MCRAASQIGAMPVVDVNAGTDAELILALSEAGIKSSCALMVQPLV